MQQRTRRHRSGPCARGPSPTSCLSQGGPLARPSPLALLWRGPATVAATEAREGGRPGRSCGRREARALYLACSSLGSAQPATAGLGGQFSGRQEPPLELPGLLRGGKGVQSPRPRWKPNGLSRSSWAHAEAPQDHGCLDMCAMDMHHLWGVRGGGGQPLSFGGPPLQCLITRKPSQKVVWGC